MFVWTSYDADAIETSNQKGERGAGVEYRTASGGIPACAAAAAVAVQRSLLATTRRIMLEYGFFLEGWLKISFERLKVKLC